MNTPTPVTLRSVALVAKSSLSTVSLALRNDPRLTVQTRERIQKIAKALGYRPNLIFSAMMMRNRQKRSEANGDVIAYVSAFATEAKWRRMFPQPEIFAGAQKRAAALNFRIEPFFYIEQGLSEERLQQVLLARGIRGLIVAPFPNPEAELPLDWSHFASATIGYTLRVPMLHRVTADHFYNMRLAFVAAREAGYRRIGCVLPKAISRRIEQLWAAGATHSEEDDLKFDSKHVPSLVMEPDLLTPASVLAWYRQHRPDFVVTRVNRANNDVAAWLREKLGRRCPPCAELSLAGRSHYDCGVDEHPEIIGATAVDLVINQLQHNELGVPARPTLTLLPGEWRWLRPAAGQRRLSQRDYKGSNR
jgi:LacI family transcriptional regulator